MKNTNQTNVDYPRLLDNQPCGEDLFASKSHEKIAIQIAKLLQDKSVHAIGIDGGWGSGKSNLIELIKKQLEDSQCHFLVYDSWGYQTDFQRRSILENITADLIDNKLISKDKWNGRLLQLLSRKRTVGAKVIRGLNPIAKVGGILAILIPIIFPLISLISERWIQWGLYGLVFILAIVIIVFIQIRDMRRYGQPISFLSVIQELFVSYYDYASEKSESKESIQRSIKYETIYDEEPSSRDFRLWMKDIDDELHQHKFVLVIDNMDRLPKAKVQELWSAINTLFAEQHYKNITIIVPFDREHIKYAFQSEDIENNHFFGEDFINKTFNVVYRVSPPIISDWKNYFALMWKHAFGEDAVIDENITQIYDVLVEHKTPRDITAYINKFVSIKQIIEGNIPDKYIALYICGEQKIKAKPYEEITKPSYLGALQFMYEEDEQLPKYIAALYYQVNPNKALEIAYLDRLRKALNTGDVADIKIISELTFFESLLENAIISVSNVPNAVVALDSLETGISKRFWDSLYNKIITFKEDRLRDYQIILINHITKAKQYTQKIVNDFYEAEKFDAVLFHQSIEKLIENRTTNPLEFIKPKTVKPSEFVRYVIAVGTHYTDYNIICDAIELDAHLSTLGIEDIQKLSGASIIFDRYQKLEKFKSHLEGIIEDNINDLEKVSMCYNLLKQIDKTSIVKRLSPDQVYPLFNNCDENNEFRYDLLAMRLAKYNNLKVAPYTDNIGNYIYSNNAAVVEKVASVIEYYTTYSDILINAPKLPKQTLLKDVAINLTLDRNRIGRLNLLAVLRKYDIIKQYLELDATQIITRFNDWQPNDITIENVTTIPLDFFKDVAKNNINNRLTNHCIAQYKTHLNIITTEEWSNHIANADNEYEMLQYIGGNKVQTCFDAFKKLLVDRATGENSILSNEKRDYLLGLAEKKGYPLKAAFNNVRDKFYNGVTMTNELFSCYGELLLKYATLNDRNPSTLRTIFPNSLFDEDSNVRLIIQYKDLLLRIYNKASDEEKSDFRNKVQNLIDGKYKDKSNSPEGFEEFAYSIGVTRTAFLEKVADNIKKVIGKS